MSILGGLALFDIAMRLGRSQCVRCVRLGEREEEPEGQVT